MDSERTFVFDLGTAQRNLFFGSLSGSRGLLEGHIEQAGILDLLARQQFGNAQNLQAWIFVSQPRRLVETRFGGFLEHGLGRRFHGDEYADLGFFALNDAAQVTDIRSLYVPGFDGENNLLALAALVLIVEVKTTIDALVRTLLLLQRTRTDQTKRPPLKLIGIILGESLSAGQVSGSPMTS